MKTRRILLPLLPLIAFTAASLTAQAAPQTAFPAWHAADEPNFRVSTAAPRHAIESASPPADPLALGLAGLAGSAAGVLGGGYLGYHIERAGGPCGDWCGLGGLLFGAAVGSAVLTPVAVHMANGARGDLGTTVFTSAVITGVGTVLALGAGSGEMLVAVPVLAIVGSVALERSTTPVLPGVRDAQTRQAR